MADSGSMSITFRFPKSILQELKEDAEHKNISINALLNQIVASYVEWHARATKAGFITVSRVMIKTMFDSLTEEEIDRLAKSSAEEMKDMCLLMVRKHTQRSILEFMERWVRMSDFGYRHMIDESSSLHTYIIQHDMGYKWSHYLSKLFSYTAEEVVLFKPEISIGKDMVVLKIREK
ncbi:hypothetical protein NTE_02081 [Candidatus Nitrososphaera evergladensis SR1]|jgi:hypothetical protein|uniref:Uncharacterized protein n=1 Tax=Candidatus Nitrososphaera evergladensis SR1 TaxID=1459636 RepID=A0A075MTN9_9ARCH|nr:hypothetical protein [Candidatus Nitrososphaera evergladensis]AIF84137.1 hypothetical protein NTE_02081 [Candidatus Nitrososphaera evergladensis SR1]